jgi:hypothetical protein
MPANTGRCPPHELVDLRLANGWIARNRKPEGYDWKLGSACKGVPIASWQRSEG